MITVSALTGEVAAIRWSYHQAATLERWTVKPVKGGAFTLSATLREGDAYRLRQAGLMFVVKNPAGAGEWRWPITTLDIQGNRMTGTLGAPIK